MLEFAPTGFIRGGLPCRRDCGQVFRPIVDSVEAITAAALERNHHEQEIHGYVHVVTDLQRPQFGNPVARGRKVRT